MREEYSLGKQMSFSILMLGISRFGKVLRIEYSMLEGLEFLAPVNQELKLMYLEFPIHIR